MPLKRPCAKLAAVFRTLFLDDMQKYTDGWAAMGGTAVLIGKENGRPLSADAVPMVKARAAGQAAGLKPGKTLRLNSIYEMKGLLNE